MRNSNASNLLTTAYNCKKATRVSAEDISFREVTIKEQTAQKANRTGKQFP